MDNMGMPSLSERQIIQLLEQLTTGVVLSDASFNLLWMNSAAEALLGISARKSKNKSVLAALQAVPLLAGAMEKVRLSAEPIIKREIPLRGGLGEVSLLDALITPVISGTQVTHILLEVVDGDWLQRVVREENLQAQDSVTHALMRGMAHEIKNPLGGIRGAAQLLERELDSEAHREYTRLIVGEVDRLRKLLDRMLLPEAPLHQSQQNIHEITEHVRQLVQAEVTGLQIRRDYDPSLPELRVDRDQVIQALLNVVRNAVYAVKDGGDITLRTRAERQITLNGQRHKLAVRMEVIDTGSGIAPEMAEKLFFPLVSGRAEGTGLGLAISRSLMQRQGGNIEFSSQPGRTIFSLTLPVIAHE